MVVSYTVGQRSMLMWPTSSTSVSTTRLFSSSFTLALTDWAVVVVVFVLVVETPAHVGLHSRARLTDAILRTTGWCWHWFILLKINFRMRSVIKLSSFLSKQNNSLLLSRLHWINLFQFPQDFHWLAGSNNTFPAWPSVMINNWPLYWEMSDMEFCDCSDLVCWSYYNDGAK